MSRKFNMATCKEDKKLFSDNEINKLYSFSNNNILLNIIAKDEIENKEK